MKRIVCAALLCVAACGNVQESGAIPAEGGPKALSTIAEKPAPPSEKQVEEFGSLTNYIGMTFKGSPSGDSTEAFVDIQKWEWGLDGNTILIRHALEDGSYGGDTHVYKDAKTGKLTYVYITSAGYHTVGEMIPNDGGWVAEEEVTGHETITRVRSTSVVDADGVWTMNAEYLKSGEWVPGHEFKYEETDTPLPILVVE